MTSQYTKKLIKRFRYPKYVKKLKSPDGVGEVGNIQCGDIMHLEIKVKNNKIQDIGFNTFGCAAAIASSGMLTEMAIGNTLDEALEITRQDVAEELAGLPPSKMHCSNLAADALHAAIEDYRKKKVEVTEKGS